MITLMLKVLENLSLQKQQIDHLKLKNFRLYETLDVSFSPYINVIIGDNAQGKTSLIESMFCLIVTKSHRTTVDSTMIKEGAEFSKMTASAKKGATAVELEMILSREGKKARYNHVEYQRLSDFMGQMHVVMFAPEDLMLVKGSPAVRRRFIDLSLSQLNRHYVYHLTQYRKLLKERNEQLKKMQKKQSDDRVLLDVLSEQLSHYGQKIIDRRRQFIEQLKPTVVNIFKSLSDTSMLDIQYEPSVQADFTKALKAKESLDIALGTTTVGPHRDDCLFYFGHHEVKTIGSQGQTRALTLALKLALIDYYKQEKNVIPIILLDDVFSELDQTHQHNLLALLDQEAQIFMTTTDLNNIQNHAQHNIKVIQINQGTIKGVDTHGKYL